MTNWFLIISGVFLVVLAFSIIIRHKTIWKCSLEHYEVPASKILDVLRRPSKESYYLNLFLIWPLVMLIGFVAAYFGIFFK